MPSLRELLARVLYYALSTRVAFESLSMALEDFKRGKRPAGQAALEDFLGYR